MFRPRLSFLFLPVAIRRSVAFPGAQNLSSRSRLDEPPECWQRPYEPIIEQAPTRQSPSPPVGLVSSVVPASEHGHPGRTKAQPERDPTSLRKQPGIRVVRIRPRSCGSSLWSRACIGCHSGGMRKQTDPARIQSESDSADRRRYLTAPIPGRRDSVPGGRQRKWTGPNERKTAFYLATWSEGHGFEPATLTLASGGQTAHGGSF